MRRSLGLLVALALLVAALPSVSAAAETEDLGAPLGESIFVGGLTAGPDGNIWFSARNSSGSGAERKVGKVTADGTVTEFDVPTEGPYSIAAGSDGNVWFAESAAIGRITPSGEITSFALPAGAGALQALTAGPGGNIWFVTARPSAVGSISPAGAVTMFPLPKAGAPGAITAGPSGDLWFTEPKVARIGRITVAGEVSEFAVPGAGARPGSITLGADGNLWFSDSSKARVGRVTPTGQFTFYAVPTITSTDEVAAGPGGLIWFTAGDEIGTVSTAGKVSWPTCYSEGCQYPPSAMTAGPEGSFWIASGEGHCPGYCGGGSELSYVFGQSSIGRYTLPAVNFGIGPRLSPIRRGHTSVVIGCGEASGCSGALRLRALIRRPYSRKYESTFLSKLHYTMAPGEIRTIALRLPAKRWSNLRYGRGFAIVDALQGGTQVAKRGFYFTAVKGGTAKHFY